jgi:CubicO group peptidase (beta-lactamase class C family)
VDRRKVEIVVDTRTEARSLRVTDLSDLLVTLAGKHRVPGAQLAVHHHGATVAVETGEQVIGGGRQVTAATAFPIGSVSKAFTATLAMILVADDDVDLDAPVGEYLPEADELGDEFTVRRLLSHTSGLTADPAVGGDLGNSVQRYVAEHCRADAMLQPPGTGFSYSNIGYVLAGRLIEVTTGMTWWDAMESILLRPLGIEPAFIGAHLGGLRRVASGHSVNPATGRARPVQQSLSRSEAPAGGLAVSATDLINLGLLHLDGGPSGLLPERWAAQMRQPLTGAEPFGLADGWGLGLATYSSGDASWVGHDGNGNGTACYFRVSPDSGWAVALTSNANTGYGLWQDVLAGLGAMGVPIEPHRARTSTRPARAPLACAGSYVNGDVEYQVTVLSDGRLDLSADGELLGRVTCADDLTFRLRDPAAPEQEFYGRFHRDGFTGLVDGIQLGGRLARRANRTSQIGRRLTA